MAVFSGNGSVGSPSFTFSSDTDTGFYRVGDGDIGFVRNGNRFLRANANGVAIGGSTSPISGRALVVEGDLQVGTSSISGSYIFIDGAGAGSVGYGIKFDNDNTRIYGSTANSDLFLEVNNLDLATFYATDGRFTYNSAATSNPVFTISEAGSELMRLSGGGQLLVGTTAAASSECLFASETYRALNLSTTNNRGYSERVKIGSLTTGVTTNLLRVVIPAGQSTIYCRLTVSASASAPAGPSPGYAGAVSIREMMFSGYGGAARLIYNNELRNFKGSVNAGVIDLDIATGASVSGSAGNYTLSTTMTPTITGSGSATIGDYHVMMEVFSQVNDVRIESF